MFDKLLIQWEAHRGLLVPASSPIQLWASGGRGVWISDSWGPAVPYHAIDHEDGHKNYGYICIKGDATAARSIPEVADFPGLADLLVAINAAQSPIETVGCEKCFVFSNKPNEPAVKLGVYIDVIFSDVTLNKDPENMLRLSSNLLRAVENCEEWWGNVSMVLQRMRFVGGVKNLWGLMLRIDNGGRSEDEAREYWNVTGQRLIKAVMALPSKWDSNIESR
jgi:hypothetical protein